MANGMLDGQVALVTGATRGIGRAIAQAFKTEGAFVIGTRTRAGDDEPCDEWIVADFSDAAQIRSCARRLRDVPLPAPFESSVRRLVELPPASSRAQP